LRYGFQSTFPARVNDDFRSLSRCLLWPYSPWFSAHPDDRHDQFPDGVAAGREVIGDVHEHLVDGIYVDVCGRYILEIDIINFRTALHIKRHMRRRDKIDIEVGWNLRGRLIQNRRLLIDPVHPKASNVLVLFGIAYHVIKVSIPDQVVRTEYVYLTAVFQCFFLDSHPYQQCH
jgi:hypothetical protein